MPARTPQCHIRLDGAFALANLDRLLCALAPLDAIGDETLVIIDLYELERISAPTLAVLVSALLDVAARGVLAAESRIVAPRDAAVERRLQEFDVLELLVDTPPHEAFARQQDRGSRPCQQFTAEDDPGQVAQSLTEAMAEVCDTDGPARHATWFALNEVAQNVIDHAGSVGGAVGIAEVTSGGTELVVAIADHGVGVRRSLARNPTYQDITSDLEALMKALRPGVTARAGRPGGLGLFFTEALLRENGGALIMRSGTARLEVGTVPSVGYELAPMHGTLVTLRFRTDNPFSLETILPELEAG